ncbi:L-alanine-DL-glutamate epimerase [Muriicola jejuensis]|uniref:Dipeptide epimerase n=1 Tax=Muriicola jejuensis TaxID=504488 RepID=A0A6P0UBS1_9FLAO|nr:dipeptide epimerase [Muriicola jejuensis]NER09088.1 dipeptide epimerase [Muriicola jejuensis]SMP11286.1 L-alanine-DL-glutamate epimerase [Muriicola jejuensis]
MKITRVSYERLDLSLSVPYTIAYETVTRASNFILKLETDGKHVGYGCAAPDLEVTGETPESAQQAIEWFLLPFLKGRSPFNYTRILEELKSLCPDNPSVWAMVDMALLDLVSKKAGVPLYHYLGGYQDSIETSITIGILGLQDTLTMAREYSGRGFRILKIKGGINLEEDIERMIRLREEFPETVFRFDGNQGYSVEDSIAFVTATQEVGIQIFEQPTKTKTDHILGEVTHAVGIPVMADESLKTLDDAFRLAQHDLIDMVNIKLMKVGGILEGMHINSVAKSAGLEAMVGCLDECALGISAGLHFALSRPNVHFADLDGHLDLENDPFQGLFRLQDGILYPSRIPGLGFVE